MCCRNAAFVCFLVFPFIIIISSQIQWVNCEKVILLSFERLPSNLFDIARTVSWNISAFEELSASGCIYKHIFLQNISSENHAYSTIISGLIKEEVVYSPDVANTCDDFIFSKIYSDSENLWVSAKNNGFNSASFYWPEDYLKVNGSSPLLSAGLLPSNGDITFYLDKITDWLSTPDVNFVSAYIPVPASENLQTNDIVQSANNVLAQLIQSVRKNKTLASVVNFVLLGGISPPKSSLNVSEVKVPVSPFRTYVSQGRAFEVWLSLLRGLHDGEEGGAESDEAVDVDPSAFLLASGPQITTCSPPAAGAEAIQLTDIYSLVSWLLGIRRPSRHAGRLSRVSRLLRVPPTAMQLEQFERHAAGLPQPAGLALLRDPSTLAFGVSVILLAAVLAVVVSIFACMHRPDVCCCVCCLRGATRRRLARSRRWRKWKSTGQGGSALLGTANGDSRSSLEADEDDLNGNEEIVILEQRSRRGNSADFLNMLHGPLESGQSRTQIPHL